MKRALVVATVASMIENFLMPNIALLQELGYEVELACNFDEDNAWSKEVLARFQTDLAEKQIRYYQIDFSRKTSEFGTNIRAFFQLQKLLREREYQLLHCHTPISSALLRAAAGIRRSNYQVFYTAHGFHFYKGAPLKNWLLYYPVEWLCAHWTDTLITINEEDYALAKKHLHAGRIAYISGVGINVDKFANAVVDRAEKRKELGIPADVFLLLSVGELNGNKNHGVIIRALANLKNPNIHYAIAGAGTYIVELQELAKALDIEKQVHLYGYRSDVPELDKASDAYVLPSVREGLNVSVMEALSSGLPVICSKIRGNVDMIRDGENGFLCAPMDTEAFTEAIQRLYEDRELHSRMAEKAKVGTEKYEVARINEQLRELYLQS